MTDHVAPDHVVANDFLDNFIQQCLDSRRHDVLVETSVVDESCSVVKKQKRGLARQRGCADEDVRRSHAVRGHCASNGVQGEGPRVRVGGRQLVSNALRMTLTRAIIRSMMAVFQNNCNYNDS